jgi:hypothetical protein
MAARDPGGGGDALGLAVPAFGDLLGFGDVLVFADVLAFADVGGFGDVLVFADVGGFGDVLVFADVGGFGDVLVFGGAVEVGVGRTEARAGIAGPSRTSVSTPPIRSRPSQRESLLARRSALSRSLLARAKTRPRNESITAGRALPSVNGRTSHRSFGGLDGGSAANVPRAAVSPVGVAPPVGVGEVRAGRVASTPGIAWIRPSSGPGVEVVEER